MLNRKKYDYTNVRGLTKIFDSGICSVYKATERQLTELKGSFNFYDESVSGRQYWDAYVNNIGIDRTISIPIPNIDITAQDIILIGTKYYEISRTQMHDNGYPNYLTISLSEARFNYIPIVQGGSV